MVVLLEELENKGGAIDPTALESAMAFHKEALVQCDAMLRCARCSARSEHMILLTVACEKLVALCEKVLHRYVPGAYCAIPEKARGQFLPAANLPWRLRNRPDP